MARLDKQKQKRNQPQWQYNDYDLDNINPDRTSSLDDDRVQTGRIPRKERRFDASREFGGNQRNMNSDYSGYNPLGEIGEGIGEQGFSNTSYDRERNYRNYKSESQALHFGKGPKGWKRSDENIREEACEALFRDAHIDASDIEVTVEEGCVYLRGFVEDRSAKRRAEECVEHISGVEDVQNELRLSKNTNNPALPEMKSRMSDARNASLS